jgi:hypothetical protein
LFYEKKFSMAYFITFCNFFIDCLNHFVFMALNFVLDVILIIKVRINLSKQHLESDKSKKKMHKAKLNSYKILVFNTSLNLVLRFPEMFNLFVIYDPTLIYLYSVGLVKSSFLIYFINFFNRSYLMALFYRLTRFLYIVSLSVSFFTFYAFNTHFRNTIKFYFHFIQFDKKKSSDFFFVQSNFK